MSAGSSVEIHMNVLLPHDSRVHRGPFVRGSDLYTHCIECLEMAIALEKEDTARALARATEETRRQAWEARRAQKS